jgi:hypothetical protein
VLLFLLQAPLSFRQRCEMPKVKVKKLGEGHGENAKCCNKNQGSAGDCNYRAAPIEPSL